MLGVAMPGVGSKACPGLSRNNTALAMSIPRTSVHTPTTAITAILILSELVLNSFKRRLIISQILPVILYIGPTHFPNRSGLVFL
jgi:hypothetical protein